MKKLIIFDINGTIIERDSRTDIPYSISLDEILSIKNAMKGIDTSARSDEDVFKEALEKNGFKFSSELWKRFLIEYQKNLEIYKDTDIWRENAGAVKFIKHLDKKGYPLALMTGELSIGAKYKLDKLGIWRYFPVGGFGEDGLIRFDIAKTAIAKAVDYYKTYFNDIIMIGDTILDIKTARHMRSRVISIATGSNTYEELQEHGPDLIIHDFHNLDIIEGLK